MGEHQTEEKCAEPGCERTYKSHRWGSIKTQGAGWFLQQDGTSWCPAHVPDWVEEWRARKRS